MIPIALTQTLFHKGKRRFEARHKILTILPRSNAETLIAEKTLCNVCTTTTSLSSDSVLRDRPFEQANACYDHEPSLCFRACCSSTNSSGNEYPN